MLQKKVRQLIFFTPLFCCCFWILDPETGMAKIRIRDKHPESATLKQVLQFFPEGHLYRMVGYPGTNLISWTDGDKVSELAAVVVIVG